MAHAGQTCFLATNPLPDHSHLVMGRTLTQAQKLFSSILAKHDDFDYTNPSVTHWSNADYCKPGKSRIHKNPHREYSIDEDFHVLDDIYHDLNQILSDRLLSPPGVKWTITGKDVDRDEWERYAHEATSMTIDPRAKSTCTRDTNESRIMLWERPDMNDRNQRMLYYVEDLFHGMIHAFIIRYTCKCTECAEDYIELEYKTGHGIVWQEISRDLEKFCLEKLDIKVDLKRENAMAEEWHSYGGVVDEKLCQELDLDVAKVNAWLRSLEASGSRDPIPFYHGATRMNGNPVGGQEDVVVLR